MLCGVIKKAHEETKKKESSINQACVCFYDCQNNSQKNVYKDGTNVLIIGEHPGKQNSHSVDTLSVV